jgi:hypothetical protein
MMIECTTANCVRPQIAAYGVGVAEAVWNNRLADTRPGADTRPEAGAQVIGEVRRSPSEAGLVGDDITWPPDAVTLAAYGKYRNAREENRSGRSAMRSALREALRVQSLKPFTAAGEAPRRVEPQVRYPSSK